MTIDRESLEPLPADVQAVLDAGRSGAGPDAEARVRLLGRIAATSGLAITGAAHAPAAQAAPAASAASGAAKAGLLAAKPLAVAVVFALGAAAGVGAHVAWQAGRPPVHAHAPRPSVPSVPSPAPIAVPVPVPVVVPTVIPAPAVASPHDRRTARHPPSVDLAAESALVERARTALGRGDAAAALAAIDEHTRRFPRGTMSEERDAVRIQALALTGRLEDARARARDFRARFPHSLFVPVIDHAVGHAVGE
jgi:hypothetical protein